MNFSYLNEDMNFLRLVSEWKKYGKLVIAYDFDNTVYDYHKIGLKIEPIIAILNEAKKIGAYFIVHTARLEDEYDFVRKYLIENNIPFDCINENIEATGFNTKKPFYNILLDDRAGLRSAYEDLSRAIKLMKVN